MIIKTLNISKIVVGPGKKSAIILEDISIGLDKGDFLTILGPSGSGKTTLLQILGLMDTPSSGEMNIFDRDIKSLSLEEKAHLRANEIGFIFQKPFLINDLTLEENLRLATKLSKKETSKDIIDNILETVGLIDKKLSYPKMLSTGEAQRGSLARAIINQPALIIADEPTASLDRENKLTVLDLLKKFNSEKSVSIILASHDSLVLEYCKSFLKLKDGKIHIDS